MIEHTCFDWIDNLPEVGRPILSKKEDLKQSLKEITTEMKRLQVLYDQVMLEDGEPLLKQIDKFWTREEQLTARNWVSK